MPELRIQQVKRDMTSIGSEDAVNTSFSASMEAIAYNDVVTETVAVKSASVVSNRGLNDPGAVNTIEVLEQSARSAFEEQAVKPLPAVPTADFVTHSSFKEGSKFIIKIVPTQDNVSKDLNLRRQIQNDQKLYFDRASLQASSEVHEERFQIFESFDDETVFLFGDRPKIWTFQLAVLNGARTNVPLSLQQPGQEEALERFMFKNNMDFADELTRRYEKYYKGSAALKLKARLYMSYEDVILEATLLSMVVTKNNMTAVANVSITFVVHERSFMGNDLTFGIDATLSALLRSNDQSELIGKGIQTSTVIQGKKTVERVLSEYEENQQAAQESQALATKIQLESEAVNRALTEAESEVDRLSSEAIAIQGQIDSLTDPYEVADAERRLADVLKKTEESVALQQEIAGALDSVNEELNTASEANDVAIARQQATEDMLKKSTKGNVVESTKSVVFVVSRLETISDGTRIENIWQTSDETEANAVASGADPSSLPSLSSVTQIVHELGDASVESRQDGVIVSKERTYA